MVVFQFWLTHWGRDNMAAISQTTFSNAFSWMKILIEISLKFVPRVPINNIPALVQIMAWRRLGDKPLSEQMMDSLPTHICVTRPQWVNVCIHTHWLKHFCYRGTHYLLQFYFLCCVISNTCPNFSLAAIDVRAWILITSHILYRQNEKSDIMISIYVSHRLHDG